MGFFFAHRGAAHIEHLKRSAGALVGIVQGILCDGALSDSEILFLQSWLKENKEIAAQWPGDVLSKRVQSALKGGFISDSERAHLLDSLRKLLDGALEDIESSVRSSGLTIDEISGVEFPGSKFCLTGDFLWGPREKCSEAITERGGIVSGSVTLDLKYLVVDGLGSAEWKFGFFGTKIVQAITYKRRGLPIFIIHEDQWAAAL